MMWNVKIQCPKESDSDYDVLKALEYFDTDKDHLCARIASCGFCRAALFCFSSKGWIGCDHHPRRSRTNGQSHGDDYYYHR